MQTLIIVARVEVSLFLNLSSALPILEDLTIYGEGRSPEIDDFKLLESVQFSKLKYFKCNNYKRRLNERTVSHIIENCFPSLKYLKLGDIYGTDNSIKIRRLPLGCDSFSATRRGIILLSSSCIKQIRNLLITVDPAEQHYFPSVAVSLLKNFSLNVLNIVLERWYFEHYTQVFPMIIKIIEKHPEPEILSVQRAGGHGDLPPCFISDWKTDNKILLEQSGLKLVIIDTMWVWRKLNISAENVRLIYHLDAHGFCIRPESENFQI